jgi:hypothetical protein
MSLDPAETLADGGYTTTLSPAVQGAFSQWLARRDLRWLEGTGNQTQQRAALTMSGENVYLEGVPRTPSGQEQRRVPIMVGNKEITILGIAIPAKMALSAELSNARRRAGVPAHS